MAQSDSLADIAARVDAAQALLDRLETAQAHALRLLRQMRARRDKRRSVMEALQMAMDNLSQEQDVEDADINALEVTFGGLHDLVTALRGNLTTVSVERDALSAGAQQALDRATMQSQRIEAVTAAASADLPDQPVVNPTPPEPTPAP